MQPVLQQRGVDPRQAQPLAQAAQQPVVVEHIAQVLKVPHLLQPAAAEEKVGGGHEYVARQQRGGPILCIGPHTFERLIGVDPPMRLHQGAIVVHQVHVGAD